MSKDPNPPVPKPPTPIKADVKNPRYEGATFEMVVKAMLQRPKKADQEGDGEQRRSEKTSDGTPRG